MKNIFYKIAYNGTVNKLLRNTLLPLGKKINKTLISVSGILDIKYNDDIQFKLKTNQTCSVTQHIFYKGAENYEFSKFFYRIIQKSDVLFDIGANIGFFSVLGPKINKNLKVYAFEPSIGPLHYLRENIRINNLQDQVIVTGKAVSNIDGTLEFHSVVNSKYPWLEHNLSGSHSLQNNFGVAKVHTYPVQVISLNHFVEEHQITKIDLIKLDTECTEHMIIDDSTDLINKFRPIIISEVYDYVKEDMNKALNKLKDYSVYLLVNNQLHSMDSILSAKHAEDEFDFVFCPNEKKAFIESI